MSEIEKNIPEIDYFPAAGPMRFPDPEIHPVPEARAPADISRLLRPDARQPHWPGWNAELFATQSLDMAMAALAQAQAAVERAQRRLAAVREGENR